MIMQVQISTLTMRYRSWGVARHHRDVTTVAVVNLCRWRTRLPPRSPRGREPRSGNGRRLIKCCLLAHRSAIIQAKVNTTPPAKCTSAGNKLRVLWRSGKQQPTYPTYRACALLYHSSDWRKLLDGHSRLLVTRLRISLSLKSEGWRSAEVRVPNIVDRICICIVFYMTQKSAETLF